MGRDDVKRLLEADEGDVQDILDAIKRQRKVRDMLYDALEGTGEYDRVLYGENKYD